MRKLIVKLLLSIFDFQFTAFMQSCHKPQRKVITKTIALLISLSFLLPVISWAFDGSAYLPMHKVFHQNRLVEIPSKFGQVMESFQGQDPLVVHIQDLHCNYEVQQNIDGIIDHLAAQYGLKQVAIEGESLPINTTQISTFPNKKVQIAAGQELMRMGKLSGPAFSVATSKYQLLLDGIEEPKLYSQSRDLVMEFLTDENQGYIYDLREMLDELKAKIYHPALLCLDKEYQDYMQGNQSLLEYCVALCRQAKKHKGLLKYFPVIAQYVSKRENVLPRKINHEQLHKEAEQLDKILREQLYVSEPQRDLDSLSNRLNIMERLLNISVSVEDLSAYLANPGFFKVKEFTRFFNLHGQPDMLLIEPEIFQLDSQLEKVGEFYRLVDKRSEVFVENTLSKLNEGQKSMAVLVTGGFHTEHVLAELEQRQVSYLSIQPGITRQDMVNPYFALLRNQRSPLEKLLAKNQDILMLKCGLPGLGNRTGIYDPAELSPADALQHRFVALALLAAKLAKSNDASAILRPLAALGNYDYNDFTTKVEIVNGIGIVQLIGESITLVVGKSNKLNSKADYLTRFSLANGNEVFFFSNQRWAEQKDLLIPAGGHAVVAGAEAIAELNAMLNSSLTPPTNLIKLITMAASRRLYSLGKNIFRAVKNYFADFEIPSWQAISASIISITGIALVWMGVPGPEVWQDTMTPDLVGNIIKPSRQIGSWGGAELDAVVKSILAVVMAVMPTGFRAKQEVKILEISPAISKQILHAFSITDPRIVKVVYRDSSRAQIKVFYKDGSSSIVRKEREKENPLFEELQNQRLFLEEHILPVTRGFGNIREIDYEKGAKITYIYDSVRFKIDDEGKLEITTTSPGRERAKQLLSMVSGKKGIMRKRGWLGAATHLYTASKRVEQIGLVYKEDKPGRIKQIKMMLEEVGKDQKNPGSGELPTTVIIGDIHGAETKRFLGLIGEAFEILFGFDRKLVPDKTLREQLTSQELNALKNMPGTLIINGDITDRGTHAMRDYFFIKELCGLAPDRVFYIPGNHCSWWKGALEGIHVPWYEDFNFYGDENAKKIVAEYREKYPEQVNDPVWWSGKLYEYDQDQDKFHKTWKNGKAGELREKFIGYYNKFKSNWNDEQLDAWEKIAGHTLRISVPKPYLGLNGIGKTSVEWWQRVHTALIEGHKARQDLSEEEDTAWQEAIALAQELRDENKVGLAKAIEEDKWWYPVLASINNQAYASVEWWSGEAIRHKNWGTLVLDEINELGLEEFEVTQANYMQSKVLQDFNKFLNANPNSYYLSPYGGGITHGWYPVEENGDIKMEYEGQRQHGRGIFNILKQLSEDATGVNGKKKWWSALHYINTWFADATIRIKPVHVRHYVNDIGVDTVQAKVGLPWWGTGHNVMAALELPFLQRKGDYTHIANDKGMSGKFQEEGSITVIGPGMHLYGYERKDSKRIIVAPRTIAKKTGERIENIGMPREEFLRISKAALKRELKWLKKSDSVFPNGNVDEINTFLLWGKNIALGSAIAAAISGLLALYAGQIDATIFSGVIFGIISAVVSHEYAHRLQMGWQESKTDWQRMTTSYRDGRDITQEDTFAGPLGSLLVGLLVSAVAGIWFGGLSPALGIALAFLSINGLAFVWGDGEVIRDTRDKAVASAEVEKINKQLEEFEETDDKVRAIVSIRAAIEALPINGQMQVLDKIIEILKREDLPGLNPILDSIWVSITTGLSPEDQAEAAVKFLWLLDFARKKRARDHLLQLSEERAKTRLQLEKIRIELYQAKLVLDDNVENSLYYLLDGILDALSENDRLGIFQLLTENASEGEIKGENDFFIARKIYESFTEEQRKRQLDAYQAVMKPAAVQVGDAQSPQVKEYKQISVVREHRARANWEYLKMKLENANYMVTNLSLVINIPLHIKEILDTLPSEEQYSLFAFLSKAQGQSQGKLGKYDSDIISELSNRFPDSDGEVLKQLEVLKDILPSESGQSLRGKQLNLIVDYIYTGFLYYCRVLLSAGDLAFGSRLSRLVGFVYGPIFVFIINLFMDREDNISDETIDNSPRAMALKMRYGLPADETQALENRIQNIKFNRLEGGLFKIYMKNGFRLGYVKEKSIDGRKLKVFNMPARLLNGVFSEKEPEISLSGLFFMIKKHFKMIIFHALMKKMAEENYAHKRVDWLAEVLQIKRPALEYENEFENYKSKDKVIEGKEPLAWMQEQIKNKRIGFSAAQMWSLICVVADEVEAQDTLKRQDTKTKQAELLKAKLRKTAKPELQTLLDAIQHPEDEKAVQGNTLGLLKTMLEEKGDNEEMRSQVLGAMVQTNALDSNEVWVHMRQKEKISEDLTDTRVYLEPMEKAYAEQIEFLESLKEKLSKLDNNKAWQKDMLELTDTLIKALTSSKHDGHQFSKLEKQNGQALLRAMMHLNLAEAELVDKKERMALGHTLSEYEISVKVHGVEDQKVNADISVARPLIYTHAAKDGKQVFALQYQGKRDTFYTTGIKLPVSEFEKWWQRLAAGLTNLIARLIPGADSLLWLTKDAYYNEFWNKIEKAGLADSEMGKILDPTNRNNPAVQSYLRYANNTKSRRLRREVYKGPVRLIRDQAEKLDLNKAIESDSEIKELSNKIKVLDAGQLESEYSMQLAKAAIQRKKIEHQKRIFQRTEEIKRKFEDEEQKNKNDLIESIAVYDIMARQMRVLGGPDQTGIWTEEVVTGFKGQSSIHAPVALEESMGALGALYDAMRRIGDPPVRVLDDLFNIKRQRNFQSTKQAA